MEQFFDSHGIIMLEISELSPSSSII